MIFVYFLKCRIKMFREGGDVGFLDFYLHFAPSVEFFLMYILRKSAKILILVPGLEDSYFYVQHLIKSCRRIFFSYILYVKA